MLELARTLEDVVGRPVNVQLVEYPDTYPADEPQRRCPDISKAMLQLNYKPTVSLREGLKRFMEWASTAYTGAQWR